MISAVIIEDEKKSSELLEKLIADNISEIKIIGRADSVKSGIELLEHHKPELVFLDIALPDGSGFDILEKVFNGNQEIIFTTASDKYAIKAIKYSAIDYLLKPIDLEELKEAVKKVIQKRSVQPNLENLQLLLQNLKSRDEKYQRITLPTGNAYEIINVADIIRCEADGNYTRFYLAGGKKILVSNSMKHYEELLPPDLFIRVHHSHLINIKHMVRFLKTDGGYAVMSDGAQVEISRRKKESFMQLFEKM